MKRICFFLIAQCFLIAGSAQSRYNHREAFNPVFYPQAANQYRSASGEPGPQYWQNRADYKLSATLDTTAHKVKGEVAITYTNNSTDNLKFLWLHVDQNIYKPGSRG